MNWSIEQNYILLQFIHCYGEQEWSKHIHELRDLFSIFLTIAIDSEINNQFTEDDFRRQYNYILATTRQECHKQGLRVVKSTELTDIALKNFSNYLKQPQPNRDDFGQLQSDIRLLKEGRIGQIERDKLRDMRVKVANVVGEDLIGAAFGLSTDEQVVGGGAMGDEHERCLKEMSESWVRRLSDGRVCVAGDSSDLFPDDVLGRLYELAGLWGSQTSGAGVAGGVGVVGRGGARAGGDMSDSDATDTLEEGGGESFGGERGAVQFVSFERALESAGIDRYRDRREIDSGFVRRFSGQKFIAGWKLIDNDNSGEDRNINNSTELDEKLCMWEEEYGRSSDGGTMTDYLRSKVSSRLLQIISDRHNTANSNRYRYHSLNHSHGHHHIHSRYSPHSSASTQEAFATRLTMSVATESCEMTPGSQSVDTAVSHATFDELDEIPPPVASSSSIKGTNHGRKKKRPRQSGIGVRRGHHEKKNGFGSTRDSESKKKIMRNITKMVVDHPYSSILTKPLRQDTSIYKQPLLNITKISQDVMNGGFAHYEQFIETIILFFLQMKIYYLNDRETVKKIESVYADISKQLSIVYPDLNDTAPLSDLIQRRQSRFQGHY